MTHLRLRLEVLTTSMLHHSMSTAAKISEQTLLTHSCRVLQLTSNCDKHTALAEMAKNDRPTSFRLQLLKCSTNHYVRSVFQFHCLEQSFYTSSDAQISASCNKKTVVTTHERVTGYGQHARHAYVMQYDKNRDLRIVFFVRIEYRIESAVQFVFESNLRIELAVYHATLVTQPNGLQ